MRTHRIFWALGAALLVSCGSYGAPDEVVFGTAVYTQPSPTADFPSFNTYFLDTTVSVFEDDPQNPTNVQMPSQIQTTIRDNMNRLGYTEVGDILTADVGLRTALLKGTGAVYYPGYWCDYWYYYSCYYDWYYAGSYKFGTVITEMADLSTYSPPPNPPSDLKVVWTSAVYGVSTSSGPVISPNDLARIQEGIDRAFGQSPYLAH